MKTRFSLKTARDRSAMALALGLALWSGCSGGSKDDPAALARTPKEAASQLSQAFENSNAEIKRNAQIASEALRQDDFEKAVVSLQTIRSGETLTLEQGLAIHSSVVSMEKRLVSAMEAGDPRAQRAYEMLKRMKRN